MRACGLLATVTPPPAAAAAAAGTPHHQVLPVACTFVEIQQCQLCNTKATMPSSFCLTVEAKAALQARLLFLLLLFPVVLCRTKIARFSLSLFVMPLPIPLHLPPLPPCSTFHLLQVAFLCPQFALAALSTSFALLLFLHCEEEENETGGSRRTERKRERKREGWGVAKIMTLKCALY